MTAQLPKEDVLRLTEEVEIKSYRGYVYFPKSSVYVAPEELAKLIELVRKEAIADEREACAKIAEKISEDYANKEYYKCAELRTDAERGAMDCADAIRNREQS